MSNIAFQLSTIPPHKSMPSVRTQAESDRHPGPGSFDMLLDNVGGADAPASEPRVDSSKAEDKAPNATRGRGRSEPRTAKPSQHKGDGDVEGNSPNRPVKKQSDSETDVAVSALQRADVDKAAPQAPQDPELAKQPGAEIGTDLPVQSVPPDATSGSDPAIAPGTADINPPVQSAAIAAIPVSPVPVTDNAKPSTGGDALVPATEKSVLTAALAALQAADRPSLAGAQPGATEKQAKDKADKTATSPAQNGREAIAASAVADEKPDGQVSPQAQVAPKNGEIGGNVVAGHVADTVPSTGNAESKSHSAAGELVDKLADATPQQVPASTTAPSNVPQNAAALPQPVQTVLAPGTPAPAQSAAVPLAGLAVEIATQSHAGKQRFDIRLDPPDLGRIDVRLDVDRDGHVTSRLVVERAETLDLLKRDSADLQRALQQAGLKTSDNALEFSLRQQGFTRDQSGTPNQPIAHLVVPTDDTAPLDGMPQRYRSLLGLGGGLDISV